DAQLILEALADDLPAELKKLSSQELKGEWSGWVTKRDAEIRRRLIQGDEDTLVNLLLFGTSFTKEPRITGQQVVILAGIAAQHGIVKPSANPSLEEAKVYETLNARINDLIKGLTTPGNNDRLLFGRQLLVSGKGFHPETAVGPDQIKKHLLAG